MKLPLPFGKPDKPPKPRLVPLPDEPEPEQGPPASDELFIRKALEQDPVRGYELLFKRYYRPLCSHAARFLYSKELAEDVVSEVFCTFWQKKTYLGIQVSFRAYLFASVRHLAFAHLRAELGKQQKMDTGEWQALAEPPTNPQQILQYNELYLKLEATIRQLPPQGQKVFMLSRFEGKKNPAIAEELHLSVKTVEGHLTKVLQILKKNLLDGFINP
jgi:RNA polymerase sigma-70 factor (ECF subfamily)